MQDLDWQTTQDDLCKIWTGKRPSANNLLTCQVLENSPLRVEVGKAVADKLAFQHLESVPCLILAPVPAVKQGGLWHDLSEHLGRRVGPRNVAYVVLMCRFRLNHGNRILLTHRGGEVKGGGGEGGGNEHVLLRYLSKWVILYALQSCNRSTPRRGRDGRTTAAAHTPARCAGTPGSRSCPGGGWSEWPG